jgi:hypothetical protein
MMLATVLRLNDLSMLDKNFNTVDKDGDEWILIQFNVQICFAPRFQRVAIGSLYWKMKMIWNLIIKAEGN